MTSRPAEEPKRLKAEIGSPEQAFWTKLRDGLTEDNLNHERQIVLNKHIILFAETKIAAEKEKFK